MCILVPESCTKLMHIQISILFCFVNYFSGKPNNVIYPHGCWTSRRIHRLACPVIFMCPSSLKALKSQIPSFIHFSVYTLIIFKPIMLLVILNLPRRKCRSWMQLETRCSRSLFSSVPTVFCPASTTVPKFCRKEGTNQTAKQVKRLDCPTWTSLSFSHLKWKPKLHFLLTKNMIKSSWAWVEKIWL